MITLEIRILISTSPDEVMPLCKSDIIKALIKGGLEVEEGIPAIVVSRPKS